MSVLKAVQGSTGQGNTGQYRAVHDSTGQYRSGQGRAYRAVQSRAVQGSGAVWCHVVPCGAGAVWCKCSVVCRLMGLGFGGLGYFGHPPRLFCLQAGLVAAVLLLRTLTHRKMASPA